MKEIIILAAAAVGYYLYTESQEAQAAAPAQAVPVRAGQAAAGALTRVGQNVFGGSGGSSPDPRLIRYGQQPQLPTIPNPLTWAPFPFNNNNYSQQYPVAPGVVHAGVGGGVSGPAWGQSQYGPTMLNEF